MKNRLGKIEEKPYGVATPPPSLLYDRGLTKKQLI